MSEMVSVIIPVYNVEEYLKKCLDSAINQTSQDIEIICINDYSTDNSLNILKDYASKDKRIKIINNEKNLGAALSRNRGIDEAQGEYISFLDSDDWFEIDLAEKIFNKIKDEKPDIALFGHNRPKEGKFLPYETIEKIKEVAEGKNYTEYFNDFVNFVWDKVYRTSFIKDKKIKFPPNIHPTEDVVFVLECFSYNPEIIFIPECLYDYRINRAGSAMKKYDNLVLNQIKALYVLFKSDFYKNSDNEYKILCLKKLLGGVIYFSILSISKNYPVSIYISELQELISYIRNEVPDEIIQSLNEFQTIERFVAIKNQKKGCL